MIKGINTSGRYITVNGGTSSTYVNAYSGAQGVGNMRYNTSTQNMEVYDGSNWIMLNMSYPTVELTPEAESLLEWARKKRDEEFKLLSMAEKNPALKDAIEALQRAEEQVKIIAALVEV